MKQRELTLMVTGLAIGAIGTMAIARTVDAVDAVIDRRKNKDDLMDELEDRAKEFPGLKTTKF